MIDFLKLRTRCANTINALKANEQLIWAEDWEKLMRDNETIQSKLIKRLKQVKFVFYNDRLEVLMKPHYLYNNNQHNANDFFPEDCMRLLQDFFDRINVNSDKFEVVNIEFGLNVVSPVDVKELVTCIIYHNKNEFRNHHDLAFSKVASSTQKNGRLQKHKQIKAYAKGVQYPEVCNKNTFRFEVKSNRRAYIQRNLKVNCLTDLYYPYPYEVLAKLLIVEWKSVLILQRKVETSSLTPRELKSLHRLNDPREWYEIAQSSNRNSFSKSKCRLEQIMNKTKCCYKSILSHEIKLKIDSLLMGCKF